MSQEDPSLFHLDFDGPSTYRLCMFGATLTSADAIIGFNVPGVKKSTSGKSSKRLIVRAIVVAPGGGSGASTAMPGANRDLRILRGLLTSGHDVDFTIDKWDRNGIGYSNKRGLHVIRAFGTFQCCSCPNGMLAQIKSTTGTGGGLDMPDRPRPRSTSSIANAFSGELAYADAADKREDIHSQNFSDVEDTESPHGTSRKRHMRKKLKTSHP
ncbi:hypothetical protein BJ508DRAFT_307672 [Ascobolus immersus RN42]|uniref:Uncharacterized protein n=1 Tax=Ascobolus immersus RN42 TaxID=1160509 RepID=A0A3N4I200_ASCIM|nr:hypothetical protein BJ508DRAFT_307672 [Ascobolus immersus RN42]